MFETTSSVLIEFSGRWPPPSESIDGNDGGTTAAASSDASRSGGEESDSRETNNSDLSSKAEKLEKRANEIGEKIRKALKKSKPELETQVQIRFCSGSLVWDGFVLFTEVGGLLLTSAAVVTQIRRMVEFCLDRIVAQEADIPGVEVNGRTQARLAAGVTSNHPSPGITVSDRWLRVLALTAAASLLVSAGCLLIVAFSAIGLGNPGP